MSTPKPLKRPDRPPKAEAEARNADVQKKIDSKVERIRELMADIITLGGDIVADADDLAKDAVTDVLGLARRFVNHFDIVKSLQADRAAKKQRAREILESAGITPPEPPQ